MSTRVMIICIFHISLTFRVMHFLFLFYFISLFITKEKFFPLPVMEYTFLDCKQNVGAGRNTLMSISDGLGPSIFCRNMEKARLMREEMDGELFISRQWRHFSFIDNMIKVLFPHCTLTWRVNNYVSRQERYK